MEMWIFFLSCSDIKHMGVDDVCWWCWQWFVRLVFCMWALSGCASDSTATSGLWCSPLDEVWSPSPTSSWTKERWTTSHCCSNSCITPRDKRERSQDRQMYFATGSWVCNQICLYREEDFVLLCLHRRVWSPPRKDNSQFPITFSCTEKKTFVCFLPCLIACRAESLNLIPQVRWCCTLKSLCNIHKKILVLPACTVA